MDWFLDDSDKIFRNMDENLIKNGMQFYSFDDFFCKKYSIKEKYKELNLKEIKIYKMYVYSLCFENEYRKDLIWEFLNSVDYTDLRIFKEYKKEKRKKKWGRL